LDLSEDSFMYRMSEKEKPEFLELTVSMILSKKEYMFLCPIQNSFRDRVISLCSSTLYTVQMKNMVCFNVSCRVHSCWWWNLWKCIILGKLTNFVTWTINTCIRNNSISYEQFWNCKVKKVYLRNRSVHTHFFCSEWLLLWPPWILDLPTRTLNNYMENNLRIIFWINYLCLLYIH
jgi:hypothetical protein